MAHEGATTGSKNTMTCFSLSRNIPWLGPHHIGDRSVKGHVIFGGRRHEFMNSAKVEGDFVAVDENQNRSFKSNQK